VRATTWPKRLSRRTAALHHARVRVTGAISTIIPRGRGRRRWSSLTSEQRGPTSPAMETVETRQNCHTGYRGRPAPADRRRPGFSTCRRLLLGPGLAATSFSAATTGGRDLVLHPDRSSSKDCGHNFPTTPGSRVGPCKRALQRMRKWWPTCARLPSTRTRRPATPHVRRSSLLAFEVKRPSVVPAHASSVASRAGSGFPRRWPSAKYS